MKKFFLIAILFAHTIIYNADDNNQEPNNPNKKKSDIVYDIEPKDQEVDASLVISATLNFVKDANIWNKYINYLGSVTSSNTPTSKLLLITLFHRPEEQPVTITFRRDNINSNPNFENQSIWGKSTDTRKQLDATINEEKQACFTQAEHAHLTQIEKMINCTTTCNMEFFPALPRGKRDREYCDADGNPTDHDDYQSACKATNKNNTNAASYSPAPTYPRNN